MLATSMFSKPMTTYTGLDRGKVDPNDKYLAFEHFNILHAEHMRSKSHGTATKHLPPILVHII